MPLTKETKNAADSHLTPMIKSFATKVLLLTGSLAVTLIGAELVFSIFYEPQNKDVWRVRGTFQLDRELIYSLKPNEERIWKTGEFTEHVKINGVGLRDREIQEGSNDKRRILIIGDSMTFGHGVSNTETFPNQLEEIYQAQNQQVDVINAGVKGYGTDQTYKQFLTRLRSLEPDLLILALYYNDVFDNIDFPLYTIEKDTLALLDPTKNWLYILGKIDRAMPKFIRATTLYDYVFSRLSNRDLFSVLPDLDYEGLLQWSREKILLQITNLKALADVDNFEFMVVCVPYKDDRPGRYEWLPRIGLRLLDQSSDPVWKKERRGLFFRQDSHLTKKGNRVLAQKLYGFISEDGF